jgi:hypothetical protein
LVSVFPLRKRLVGNSLTFTEMKPEAQGGKPFAER